MKQAAQCGCDVHAPKKRARLPLVVVAVGILFAFVALGRVWWKYSYPYGHSHSCSAGLGSSLHLYAEVTDGWFPHGLLTPEASLSLLNTNDPTCMKWFMKGKHLSQSVVDQAMARDGFLSPSSCGWHYVEGLHEDDDEGLAIAWDRVNGLDHNGRRRSSLMREVVMKDGSHPYITERNWATFAKTQRDLIAATVAKRSSKDPPIRWSDEETLGPNRFPPSTIRKPK